jgi:hypothetical protein
MLGQLERSKARPGPQSPAKVADMLDLQQMTTTGPLEMLSQLLQVVVMEERNHAH